MTKRQHPKPQYKKCSPKTLTPKHKNQWHFIHWRFVRGIMTGYHIMHNVFVDGRKSMSIEYNHIV